jgi:hypothetical protein
MSATINYASSWGREGIVQEEEEEEKIEDGEEAFSSST